MAFTGITLFNFFNLKEIEAQDTFLENSILPPVEVRGTRQFWNLTLTGPSKGTNALTHGGSSGT